MTADLTRANEVYGTFSERFPVLYDREGRIAKARKIVAIMSDFTEAPLDELTVLDIGGSAGVMTELFSEHFREVIELDIDHVAVRKGQENCRDDDVLWLCADATCLPMPDASVDSVICNHVYEHVDDQQGLIAEIRRVLKPDGFCYFSAGSRFVLVEGHYKLPFLSWVPHWLSDLYMKVCGKEGRYDVKLLSYRSLRKLLRDFNRHDYTIPILKEPDRFAAGDLRQYSRLAFRIPTFIYRLLYPILPIWIWILTKK
jgi:ubiquinone/menaquinone biosynthesis C-methylase UbiE